jgi:hypothetical protein
VALHTLVIQTIKGKIICNSQSVLDSPATLPVSTAAMYEAMQSQDEIGWTEFTHGKVSTKFQELQQTQCILRDTRLNGRDWMKKFIGILLDMSHSQWLYQNFSLHQYTWGHLRQQTESEIHLEAAHLIDTAPANVPHEARYLLDLPLLPSALSSATHAEYWVLSMKATQQSLLLTERRRQSQGVRARRVQNRHTSNLLDEKIRPWARGLRVMWLKTIGRDRGGHPWWAQPLFVMIK